MQDITFEFNNPKIKYYETNNNLKLNHSYINFPTNKAKSFNLQFYSAADFLLNKITNNPTYVDDKYSDYYWGDQKFNNSANIDHKLSDQAWLSNYSTNINGNTQNTRYQVVLNDNNSLTDFDSNGNFNISLKMKINNNENYNYSRRIKIIKITNCIKYPNDLFSYNGENNQNKFSFKQNVEKLDNNLNSLKKHKTQILNDINTNNQNKVKITSLRLEIIGYLSRSWKSNMIISFNNNELTNNTSNGNNYYSNEYIYIDLFSIDDCELWYDKDIDIFQIKFNASIKMSNIYDSTQKITVNITKKGQSLENLKK